MNRLTKEDFLNKYKEKFQIDYIGILPDNFYGRSLLHIECSIHGISERSAFDILAARFPCQQCGKDSRTRSNRQNNSKIKISFEEHILKFRKVHEDLYDYPEQDFKNSKSKITIICKKHNKFTLHMHSHLNGVGCPNCRKEDLNLIREDKRIKREEEIEQGKKNRVNANKKRTQTREEIEIRFRGA